MPTNYTHLLPKKQSTDPPVVVITTQTANKPRPRLFQFRLTAPKVQRPPWLTARRVQSVSTATRARPKFNMSMLFAVAAVILVVASVMSPQAQTAATNPSGNGFVLITPNPFAITATPFQPEPLKIKQGTCPDGEFFMDMYDKLDPVTGIFGIGVVVFDSEPAQNICIPEMGYFEQMIANGKSGEELLKDTGFVNYTGLLASRMAIALGLPDTDLVARQGLRRAIAIAIQLAMNSPQPADDLSSGMRHGYIMMPGYEMIAAATELVRKEVAVQPNLPVMAVPKAQNGQVVQTVPTPREILERDVRAECTTKGATDVEKCAKMIIDAYLAQQQKDQTPESMKGLILNYFLMLTPTPTNAPIAIPGDNSYSTFEQKVNEACALTKHAAACVNQAKRTYAETNDLYKALQAALPAGNANCEIAISEIAFADLRARSEIWPASGTLNVWRIDNNDPSTLTGVGYANGVFRVCIDKITGAPSSVAGGTWQTSSINLVQSASQFAAQYSTSAGYFTGGIISIGSIYPADPGGGIYHVAANVNGDGNGGTVFEIPIGGLHVSPVIGVVQIQPTSVVPAVFNNDLNPRRDNIVLADSTPVPVDVTIAGLYDWASTRGFTMFYLRFACSGTPPTIVTLSDGRFSAHVDLSGYAAACPSGYFVVTTDNMSGQIGWTNVGNVWMTSNED